MENLVNSMCLPFDIRAEVLARLLGETYGLSTEQILFRPQSYFQRWGRRDVLEVSKGFSYLLDKENIALDVSREGLFDILPEGIFFHPDDKYPDDVFRAKKLSEQESDARKFLLPFEQLFYWLRLENEQREFAAENQLEQWWQELLTKNNETPDGFDGYSPLKNSLLNEEQQAILTHLLPHLPDIIGNWTLTAQWLSLFLNAPIKIIEESPPLYSFPEEVQKRMGEGILGQDFVIGTTYTDGIPILKILIEDLTPESVETFLPKGAKREILEKELLQFLLPIETPYKIETSLKIQSIEFQMGENYNSSILGYTTTLNNQRL